MISPQFFSTLSLNQTITTLMLTNGTLVKQFIPSFCQLILTNQSIVALDISDNYLEPSQDLDQAFKQNKSIKILNISENQFNQDIFDALLSSDTVQYLLVDINRLAFHQHRYFSESKSLIQTFLIGATTNMKPFHFNPSILSD
ncbi:hypothetical protein DFA_04127 [Cavenderia fasciculata]|uniref:Leucine-rich repeat-containing protein n=1 Tax=Cavenderia fasciculata TaxID=261658 RepID=F4Q1D1_CACFS|nr:uncharacterized protein DFA_04127 [Cavenderia fasciculata]EGG18632.1 hypothetical protein DFA_04127 [Cavenderia fasciculata]|eukprot:XP_004366536.1 hypothetical protein DFA_04127 [Cavenderia fasciculata]